MHKKSFLSNFQIPKVFRLPCVFILLGVLCMVAGNYLGKKSVSNQNDSVPKEYHTQITNAFIQGGATNSTVTDWRVITEYHQNRLTDFLKHVKGVGDVSVLVYCDRSSILSLVENCTNDSSSIKENDGNGGERVTENSKNQSNYLVLQDQDGNQRVVAISETIPAITSVCVVCSGGNQAGVRERVIQAISILYDLSPANIVVIQGA